MLPAFLQETDPGIYRNDNYIVLDFEVDTSHGDHGAAVHPDNELLLACWKPGPGHKAAEDGTHVRAIWGGEFEQASLLEAISTADYVVAHHAKYELGWLRRAGLDLHTVLVADTMLAEYVLLGNLAAGDETMKGRSLSLDMCCRRRGLPVKDPTVDLLMKHGVNPVQIHRPWLESRCRQDVETTEALWHQQRKLLIRTNRLAVLFTRCLLTPVLASVEVEGMALDAEAVASEYQAAVKLRKELEEQMGKMTGGINWRSSPQVAEFIYDKLGFRELTDRKGEPKRTGKGKRKTDQKTIDQLSKQATTEEQKAFIKLRKDLGKVAALLSKNLDFFQGVVNEYGGVFYAELHQANTATHRLASTGIPLRFETIKDDKGKPTTKRVQFQNMPRKLKKVFKAKRPGYLIFEPDGSQLEFRVAIGMANDKQGIADILDPNWDAHIVSGAAMEGVPYAALYERYKAGDDKAVAARQAAKTETFKPLYGGEQGDEKQMRWYAEFRRRYPELAKLQESWERQVLLTKRLITPWGLRYYWPYCKANWSGRATCKTAVYNYPVQAFATAEIIPIALVYFWHRIHQEGLEDKIVIINTVHDSVVCEVHPDHVEDAERIAKQAFTLDVYKYLEDVYGITFEVPLGCGIKTGTHWGEGDEKAYNVFRDGTEQRVK